MENLPTKKALMVTGARQIGKTTLVRHFGNTQYGCFAELNFLEDEQAKLIFEGPLDADRLISSLTAYLRKPLVPGDTLILLDEIQECLRARTAIKFLVEDGRFDYVETGSLLGVKTKDVASYPVGFEHYLRMYPLGFEEFCIANGVQESTLALLRKRFDEKVPVEDSIHDSMMRLFTSTLLLAACLKWCNATSKRTILLRWCSFRNLCWRPIVWTLPNMQTAKKR